MEPFWKNCTLDHSPPLHYHQIVRDDTTNGVDVNRSHESGWWLVNKQLSDWALFEQAKWSRLETKKPSSRQKSTVKIDKNIKSRIKSVDEGEKNDLFDDSLTLAKTWYSMALIFDSWCSILHLGEIFSWLFSLRILWLKYCHEEFLDVLLTHV